MKHYSKFILIPLMGLVFIANAAQASSKMTSQEALVLVQPFCLPSA